MINFINQSDAKLLGLKRFTTGKKCVNGHVSERRTSNGSCLKCYPLKGLSESKKAAAYKKLRRYSVSDTYEAVEHGLAKISNGDIDTVKFCVILSPNGSNLEYLQYLVNGFAQAKRNRRLNLNDYIVEQDLLYSLAYWIKCDVREWEFIKEALNA